MIIEYFMGYQICNAITPNYWFCAELNLTNFRSQAHIEIAIQKLKPTK